MAGLFDGTPLERPVTCEVCSKELSACACARDGSGALVRASSVVLRVQREKRRGKWCAVISGLDEPGVARAHDPKKLLKDLRTRLGTGGGLDGAVVVIQGDHRDAIVKHLKSLGFDAKASGG